MGNCEGSGVACGADVGVGAVGFKVAGAPDEVTTVGCDVVDVVEVGFDVFAVSTGEAAVGDVVDGVGAFVEGGAD